MGAKTVAGVGECVGYVTGNAPHDNARAEHSVWRQTESNGEDVGTSPNSESQWRGTNRGEIFSRTRVSVVRDLGRTVRACALRD